VRRVFLIAALALLAAFPSHVARGVEDVHANFERSATLEEGAWDGYQVYVLDEVRVRIDIRASGDLDFYVFTSALLARYEDPSATTFPTIHAVEKSSRFQYNTTACCRVFAIDNTVKSPTGQIPDGPEYYTIEVTYESLTTPPTSFALPAWVSWAYPAAAVSLIGGTTYWLATPPRRNRHASRQLREFLK